MRPFVFFMLATLLLAFVPASPATGQTHAPAREIKIIVGDLNVSDPTLRFALAELRRGLAALGGEDTRVHISATGDGPNTVRLALNPQLFKELKPEISEESFYLHGDAKAGLTLEAGGARGALWGVRDFIHYYAAQWLAEPAGQAAKLDLRSSPTIDTRGFWSWWHGCYDPFAYIDRASEWKLNTVCFWNQGAPLDAERLSTYARERGVDILWGFGWGWTEGDFMDATPELAQRLMALHEAQKQRNGVKPASLCPSDPATPELMKEYVLDVYQRNYGWIPGENGIYFQTATEAVCECAECKSKPLGETLLPVILPILEEMHRQHPGLKISWGVHNRKEIEQYEIMRQIPPYINICWEDGLFWANSTEQAQVQMTYRGAEEDFAGVYRMIMNCGLTLRGDLVRDLPVRRWLPRIESAWQYLEEGAPEGIGGAYRMLRIGDMDIIAPCSKDWSPVAGAGLQENQNLQYLETWSRELAEGPPNKKGIFLLVEAGLIDLKMRRAPAMAAELIWNPLLDSASLEARYQMIWNESVGGWKKTANPYWNADGIEITAAPDGGHHLVINEQPVKSWRWW